MHLKIQFAVYITVHLAMASAITVDIGDPVVLPCNLKMDGAMIETKFWEIRNSTASKFHQIITKWPLDDESEYKGTATTTDDFALLIQRAELSDEGQYRCGISAGTNVLTDNVTVVTISDPHMGHMTTGLLSYQAATDQTPAGNSNVLPIGICVSIILIVLIIAVLFIWRRKSGGRCSRSRNEKDQTQNFEGVKTDEEMQALNQDEKLPDETDGRESIGYIITDERKAPIDMEQQRNVVEPQLDCRVGEKPVSPESAEINTPNRNQTGKQTKNEEYSRTASGREAQKNSLFERDVRKKLEAADDKGRGNNLRRKILEALLCVIVNLNVRDGPDSVLEVGETSTAESFRAETFAKYITELFIKIRIIDTDRARDLRSTIVHMKANEDHDLSETLQNMSPISSESPSTNDVAEWTVSSNFFELLVDEFRFRKKEEADELKEDIVGYVLQRQKQAVTPQKQTSVSSESTSYSEMTADKRRRCFKRFDSKGKDDDENRATMVLDCIDDYRKSNQERELTQICILINVVYSAPDREIQKVSVPESDAYESTYLSSPSHDIQTERDDSSDALNGSGSQTEASPISGVDLCDDDED